MEWPWLVSPVRRVSNSHWGELFIYPDALHERELTEERGAAVDATVPEGYLGTVREALKLDGLSHDEHRLLDLAERSRSEYLARHAGGLRVPHVAVTGARLEHTDGDAVLEITLANGGMSLDLGDREPAEMEQLAAVLHRLWGSRLDSKVATQAFVLDDPVPAGAPRSADDRRYWDGHLWRRVPQRL